MRMGTSDLKSITSLPTKIYNWRKDVYYKLLGCFAWSHD